MCSALPFAFESVKVRSFRNVAATMEVAPFLDLLGQITTARGNEVEEKPGTAPQQEQPPEPEPGTNARAVIPNTRKDGSAVEDPEGKLDAWKAYAERKVREWIKFIVLPGTENQLGEQIRQWHAGQVPATSASYH